MAIYPPYNTKRAFERYDDNLEHSQWLPVMYPPIGPLTAPQGETGSSWIAAVDNEGHHLKELLDKVFGRKNFVGNGMLNACLALLSGLLGNGF